MKAAVADVVANKMVTNVHERGNCSVVCMDYRGEMSNAPGATFLLFLSDAAQRQRQLRARHGPAVDSDQLSIRQNHCQRLRQSLLTRPINPGFGK